MTHPHPNRRFVPQAVLTMSGKINTAGVSVNTAVRLVNTAGLKTTVNHPRPISNAYKKGYSQVTRPFNKYSANKNNIFNKKVNTVRVKDTIARDRAVVNENKGKGVNVVKASSCWGNPQQKEYKEKGFIDSGCSRHMTGNKCYLTEYEDYDGGFFSFRDGKGRISGKGKFDGKADEGFFVGYSVVSKVMRVFNKRTRIVEETINIRFLENTPNVTGNRPDWLFDVDSLTISMNYVPVVAGNQTNGIAGTRDNIVTGQTEKKTEPEQEYILIPICTTDPLISHYPKVNEEDAEEKPTEMDESGASDKDGEDDQATRSEFERLLQQEKQTENPNSTNSISTISTPVSTARPSCTDDDPSSLVNIVEASNAFKEHLFERFSPFKNAFTLPPVSNVTPTDDTGIFGNAYDDEDMGTEADLNNLETTMNVSPIPTTRIYKHYLRGDETLYKEWEDRMERDATTASCLDAEQDSGSGPRCQDTILGGANAQTRFETASKQSNDPPLSRGYTLVSGEDSMKLLELMEICSKWSDLVSKKKKEMFLRLMLVYINVAKHNLVLPVQVNAAEASRPDIMLLFVLVHGFHVTPMISLLHALKRKVGDEVVHKELGDRMERAATTASSSEAEQDSGSGPRCQYTIFGDVDAQTRLILVLDLEKAKSDQAVEIASLKKRVAKLEKMRQLRTIRLKRFKKLGTAKRVKSSNASLGAQEDAFKQRRSIEDIDADVEMRLFEMLPTSKKDEQSIKLDDSTTGEAVTTASVEDSAAPTIQVSTADIGGVTAAKIDELNLAQTLIEIKAAKPKVVTIAATTTTTTRPKAKGVVVQEPSEFRVPQEAQPLISKDKGKGIMIEPEVPLKRKDQIALDEQIARDIQAKLDAELIEE
ncbi:hypothetical protein Tco_0040660 [Tanacetum coccineum]